MKPEKKTPKAYEPPRIVAYDEAGLLEKIGPAVACARWAVAASPGQPEVAADDGPEEPW